MCGRYSLTAPAEELVEAFDVPAPTFDWLPRQNITPGQLCPVIAEDRHGRRLGLLEWGFIPSWKEEPHGGFINARAESVATKASFREAFARRRCLVPADGFYEWAKGRGTRAGRPSSGAGRSTPYWVHPRAGGIVSFAAVWESWRRPGDEPRHTFAILTTDANADVAEIHDRMPVVVRPEDRAGWLDRRTAVEDAARMLHPAADGTFVLKQRGPDPDLP